VVVIELLIKIQSSDPEPTFIGGATRTRHNIVHNMQGILFKNTKNIESHKSRHWGTASMGLVYLFSAVKLFSTLITYTHLTEQYLTLLTLIHYTSKPILCESTWNRRNRREAVFMFSLNDVLRFSSPDDWAIRTTFTFCVPTGFSVSVFYSSSDICCFKIIRC
jgi:hypothetical protein